jgi:hypothetical protein
MSSNSETQTASAAPEIGVLAPAPRPLHATPRGKAPPEGRPEAQLRARVAELEAQLIEVASCLEAAENRAANAQADADRAWGVVGDMANSRSWCYTGALRSVAARLRRRR